MSCKRFVLLALLPVALSLGAGCNSAPSTCATSRDCSAAGLVCDPGLGTCVECTRDGDCFAGDQVCRSSQCVDVQPCVSSRECPGRVCDLAMGFCVDCVLDVDCEGGLICDDNQCVDPPTACVSDRECSALDLVCDTVAGICVDCLRDTDCLGGNVCRSSECVAPGIDAGPRIDAGTFDSGGGVDAGSTDAGGGIDAGGGVDAGGGIDAGGGVDAGGFSPIDIMLLFDVTGSHRADLFSQRSMIMTELITPLLAAGNVRVGISYYADFPVDPYGSAADRPFVAGLAPTFTASALSAQLELIPEMGGGDNEESLVQALNQLTGGAPHASSTPFSCPGGTLGGGCFRPGAELAIVVYTDQESHNGPDGSGGFIVPYPAAVGAAGWPLTEIRLVNGGYTLFAHLEEDFLTTIRDVPVMVTALGDTPATNMRTSTSAAWTAQTIALRDAILAYYGR